MKIVITVKPSESSKLRDPIWRKEKNLQVREERTKQSNDWLAKNTQVGGPTHPHRQPHPFPACLQYAWDLPILDNHQTKPPKIHSNNWKRPNNWKTSHLDWGKHYRPAYVSKCCSKCFKKTKRTDVQENNYNKRFPSGPVMVCVPIWNLTQVHLRLV